MMLRCFAADGDGWFQPVRVETVRRVWLGRAAAPQHCRADGGFRVATVVCDRALQPKLTYFSLLRLDGDGRIDDGERAAACRAIELGNRPELEHPLVLEQYDWVPGDWQWQLAVALDVPLAKVSGLIGIGGPLQMADMHQLPLARFLEGFRAAFAE